MDQNSSEPADDHAELLRLCQRHGIAPEYHDIWGKRRVVPDHGLRALLRAMDVEAGNRNQVLASLAAEDANAAALRSPLPPVAIFWQDAGPWLLPLQAATREGRLIWELTEEGGARHAGAVNDFHVALPSRLPLGYHHLDLRLESAAAEPRHLSSTLIVVAPRRCYLPLRLREGQRVWGPAVQLYALRSERNWGIGDFTDLAAVIRTCGVHGAALVGLNPLHALYPHNPGHASPYSPSSRRFLDILYIDVESVAEFATCAPARERVAAPVFQDRLRALRAADLVDYVGVSELKLPVLEQLYAHFRATCLDRPAGDVPVTQGAPQGAPQAAPQDQAHAPPQGASQAALHDGPQAPPDAVSRAREFRAFQATGGLALRQHALFEAMQEHFHKQDPQVWGWPQWSWSYRDPNSSEVAAFAREHVQRVEYFEYLQWQAELQLAAAGGASLEAQLAVGIYQDLAVSVDRGGAESWAAQDLYAQSASAGCPPDDFNLLGQDWGLLPLLPERLRARAYAPFIAVLRANMRHAGALRIDHVMGLARLFWVPRGDLPAAGSYVAYPFEHLLAILTLESERNACMVIGEDLGTVPDEVRHAMDRSGMLSYRVLIFSRHHDGEFFSPQDFPVDALATSTTHDLATLAGYWEGRDIALRQALDLYPTAAMHLQQAEERKRDCILLLAALRRASLLPPELGADPQWPVPMTQSLAMAVQEYLARSPSRVMVVQLEDIFGCEEQINLPGTVDAYANWRRRLPVPIEQWESDGRFAQFARRLAAHRRV